MKSLIGPLLVIFVLLGLGVWGFVEARRIETATAKTCQQQMRTGTHFCETVCGAQDRRCYGFYSNNKEQP